MSKAIVELSDLIFQILRVRYAFHRRQGLAPAAKKMGASVEQVMASYLAQQMARRLDLTPQAGGNPSVRAIPPPNSRSAGDATSLGRVIGGPSSYWRNRDKSRLWIETR